MKDAKKVYIDNGEELQNCRLLKDEENIFISNGATLDNPHEVFHICMLGAGAVGKSGEQSFLSPPLPSAANQKKRGTRFVCNVQSPFSMTYTYLALFFLCLTCCPVFSRLVLATLPTCEKVQLAEPALSLGPSRK